VCLIGKDKMKLDQKILREIIHNVLNVHDGEFTCTECFEQLDRFAELVLLGRNAAEAMPLVQEHLDHCDTCREEFEALLTALRALDR